MQKTFHSILTSYNNTRTATSKYIEPHDEMNVYKVMCKPTKTPNMYYYLSTTLGIHNLAWQAHTLTQHLVKISNSLNIIKNYAPTRYQNKLYYAYVHSKVMV